MLATALLAQTVPSAHANDSIAGLANGGGLVLQKSQDIEMRTERLVISAKRIDVQYQFHNRSPQSRKTIVAFPIPDIVPQTTEEMIRAMPSDDPQNPFDFTASVNGRPVVLQQEQKALTADGRDQAEALRRLGIPLRPDIRQTYEALEKLPREQWDELVKLGVATIGHSDNTPDARQILVPSWVWKTTFYWSQNFPANTNTIVEHKYRPSVGHALGLYMLEPEFEADYHKRYCLSANIRGIVKRAEARLHGRNFQQQQIDYVLKTGANWARPINDFQLIIDQGGPENLIFACLPGLQKTTATQWAWSARNFSPTADLSILILNAKR